MSLSRYLPPDFSGPSVAVLGRRGRELADHDDDADPAPGCLAKARGSSGRERYGCLGRLQRGHLPSMVTCAVAVIVL